MQQSEKLFMQLRRSMLYALATFVVTAAVALSVARLLLPEVQGYKQAIEQRLGEIIEQNVHIDEIDARLVGFTPTIIFKGVHLIDDSGVKEIVSFKKAYLGISLIQSVLQKTLIPSDFTVYGTVISVLQKADGAYAIQGFDLSELGDVSKLDAVISKDLADWLLQQSSVSIKESTVVWKQKGSDKWQQFDDVNLILHNRDDRHQLTGSFQIPEGMGKQSKIAIDVTGDLLNPKEWRGLVYIKSNGLQLSALGVIPEFKDIKIKGGKTDFELWGEWAGSGLHHMSGNLAVYDLQFQNGRTGVSSNIEQLKGDFDWGGDISDWLLRIDQLEYATKTRAWPESKIIASWKNKNGDTKLKLGMVYAKIGDAKNLFTDLGLYKAGQIQILDQLDPTGDISNLSFNVNTPKKGKSSYGVSADISNLRLKSWKKFPGVAGLNAHINLSESSGQISLSGEGVILTAPKILRQSILLDKVSGVMNFYNSGNGWVVQSNKFEANNNDFKMALDLILMMPHNSKSHYMDVQLSFTDVIAAGIHKYQPALVLKEKLVTWFDNLFQSGTIPEINVVFRGWSKDFPFMHGNGVMTGDFLVSNVKGIYFAGWPEAVDVDVYGEFTANTILVKSDKATIHNGVIKNLIVRVDDLDTPILKVEGDAYSSTKDGFQFFSKTPVGKRSERFVSKTRFGGDIHTRMTLSVALNKQLAKKYKKRFSGYVETTNSAMYLMRERLDVTDINGRVYFSSTKHHGEGITAKLMHGDTKIRVDSKIVGDKPVMEIIGEGSFDSKLLDARFKKLGLLRVRGELPWQGKMILGHRKANSEQREPTKLQLKSSLIGVLIDLPEPFRKPAETSRPSVMYATFLPEIKTILNIQYGDRMSTEMRLNNLFFPARIEIGEMKLSAGKAKLPDKDEFRLSGVVNNMDQYGWREVMQQHYNKYHKLRTRPIVDVPVIIDFAYVNVPFDKTKAKPRKRYTSPVIMPAFKGQIKRFVFAGKEFGKLEFDSRRDNLGLAFDKIRLTSPHMEYNAKLTWHYIGSWHKTKMKGILKTSDLGSLMTSFGFGGKVKEGEGEIKLDLNWDNPFYVFRTGYTNGQIEVAVEDGVVTAVNPGAGRFLGLLSLTNLPRRLLLDFSDVGSGFGFDTITGIVNMKNGIATTKDFAVDSTVADVLAVGRVDIRKKEFDQIVTVTPQVAGTMPVVSGLLMGIGVVPLVWLFERMFGSDMDKSISRQYHITGPWVKPKVERIDKEENEKDSESNV